MRILISWPSTEGKNKNAGALQAANQATYEAGTGASGQQILEAGFCYCRRPRRRAADASPIQSCTSRPGLLSELPGLQLTTITVCVCVCLPPQPPISLAVSVGYFCGGKKTHLAASANLSQAAEDPITVVMRVTTHWQPTSHSTVTPGRAGSVAVDPFWLCVCVCVL